MGGGGRRKAEGALRLMVQALPDHLECVFGGRSEQSLLLVSKALKLVVVCLLYHRLVIGGFRMLFHLAMGDGCGSSSQGERRQRGGHSWRCFGA